MLTKEYKMISSGLKNIVYLNILKAYFFLIDSERGPYTVLQIELYF